MPIEVKELVMRFNVGQQSARQTDEQGDEPTDNANDMEHIVASCVEQVLDILERAQER